MVTEKGLVKKITIEVSENADKKELERIGNNIHFQLVGNKDYVDCNIILRLDTDAVRLYIYEEAKDVPDIII